MSKTAQKIDRHIGTRIRKRRSELGLTQGDLGEVIGLSYQQIQKYETAISRCSAGKLYELAVALEVEVSYFFDQADISKSASPLTHGGNNRAIIELIRNYNEIDDPQVKASVNGFVRVLARKEVAMAMETGEITQRRD
ncbi:MAG: helix-turn-helix domain-containing protein [Sneathiellales bacterium]|nr:helix-turn-helix domain-containing protein [Sneathiellales bacterium]